MPGDLPLSRRPSKLLRRSMDRIRRSFRDSLRRGPKRADASLTGAAAAAAAAGGKPQLLQLDEAAVRAGTCNYHVKYLGCVEVFESRGMQVCEEALKVLRGSRRRAVRAILYVSGDGLRVVDAESNRGLLLDQTIEKVSFCAPDRNHEKGFAYVCRDGTTRRWMCHGFQATKETGERLSHAVGCAFAVCLERKQRRDRDVAAAPASSEASPALANGGGDELNGERPGSLRQTSLSERLQDPQLVRAAEPPPPPSADAAAGVSPLAVARPSANPQLFERQGSLRMTIGAHSVPNFRRQASLRIGELPSTLTRQHEIGVPGARVSSIPEWDEGSPPPPPHTESPRQAPMVRAETWATDDSRAAQWLASTLAASTQRSPLPNGAPVRDLFGQPQFEPSTPPPPPPADPFEQKWQSLERSTNPFSRESAAVDI